MSFTKDPPEIPIEDYPAHHQLGMTTLEREETVREMGFETVKAYLDYLKAYRARNHVIENDFVIFMIEDLYSIKKEELQTMPMEKCTSIGHGIFSYIPPKQKLRDYFSRFEAATSGVDPTHKHYEITLTTSPGVSEEELTKRIEKIAASKCVNPIFFEYAIEHPESNIHAHCYVSTDNYIKARDILRMNKGDRCTISKVKNITAFRRYISKECSPIVLVSPDEKSGENVVSMSPPRRGSADEET